MKLTVKQLKDRDPGSGTAVIDRTALADLGVSSGDFVAIEGREDGRTVAQVWPSDERDAGQGIVRIDGELRQAAGVSIDGRVTVTPTDVADARRVEVAVPESVQARGTIASRVREHLADRAVAAGQTVGSSVGIGLQSHGSSRHPIHVADTHPKGTVVVTGETTIDIADRSLEDVQDEAGPSETGAPPSVTYEDIGGLDEELDRVRETIELPMRHPELFQQLGIDPPKGVLLHGPPGTGKTLISKAVATEIDAHFQTISGPEIMSKYYGESEERLREVFDESEENEPTIVFIDELDSIAPKREEVSGDVERRVVAQLLSLMDGLGDRGQITVIGTTNRIDAIDPALRRPGRFDREIEIGVPDRDGREEILAIHTRRMPLSDDVDLGRYAENTQGSSEPTSNRWPKSPQWERSGGCVRTSIWGKTNSPQEPWIRSR